MLTEAEQLRQAALPPTRCTSIINGEAFGGDSVLPVLDPSTGAQISELTEADDATLAAAVAAAASAFESGPWPRTRVEERQALLRRVADLVDAHAPRLASLECLNTGIPRAHLLQGQIRRVALNFRFFADYIGQASGDLFAQDNDYLTFVRRDPVGVAALLGPWNAPLALTSMKIAAAIAFGNTCVVKPSEQTPLTMFVFMSLLEQAGLPPGVVNLVNGRGPVSGAALCSHPRVDRISFTGGTVTGRSIMQAAGTNLTPVTMELGGKSANIIFASADIERALDGALLGIFSNNGQQCLAGSRILVEESIAATFIEAFVARARRIRVGDPFDPATEIGALGSRAHRDRVVSYAAVARNEGGQVLTGGTALDALEPGAYMAPTVVRAMSNRNRICQEEIFGPFATLQTFSSPDEAWALANDTPFGLVSYIWSDDLPTVMAGQARLRSGLIWVNTPMVRELRAPFGGFKESGVGREGGKACEAFYTEEKTVTIAAGRLPLTKLGRGSPEQDPGQRGR